MSFKQCDESELVLLTLLIITLDFVITPRKMRLQWQQNYARFDVDKWLLNFIH